MNLAAIGALPWKEILLLALMEDVFACSTLFEVFFSGVGQA